MSGRLRSIIEVLLPAIMLGGCASYERLDPASIDSPGFAEIYGAYQQSVTSCLASEDEVWHAGWFGNGLVYVLDDSHKGLCYQWQDVVLEAVLPVAQAEGWQAIAINKEYDKMGEHHAVLVYEKDETKPSDFYRDAYTRPAYVLDPWRRGKADVYTMAVWMGDRE